MQQANQIAGQSAPLQCNRVPKLWHSMPAWHPEGLLATAYIPLASQLSRCHQGVSRLARPKEGCMRSGQLLDVCMHLPQWWVAACQVQRARPQNNRLTGSTQWPASHTQTQGSPCITPMHCPLPVPCVFKAHGICFSSYQHASWAPAEDTRDFTYASNAAHTV